ncbi:MULTISPECIES: LacI family DNA-binding transcriptional regulator [Microbacterium]|uniref:LacI family DNA-binding transcriptional regulator n=1 Tax=Microbacterium TaxID=33882 RepID=UPI00146F86ED|nr:MULTISPECIES: LacI family DNA-binding transcriptional regulator [Microbacterium]
MNDQPPVLLAPARRQYVLDALARDGAVRIADLMRELGVTPVTLRRDLAHLEAEGLVVRVHGGAVSGSGTGGGPGATGGPSAPGALGERAPAGGCIAVLVPSLSFYWPTVVRGMEAEARRQGVRLITRGTSYELADERPVLERLVAADDVRGLILAPNPRTPAAQDVAQWLSAAPIPSVLVERDPTPVPGRAPVETVTTDHGLGAVLAARHLAERGHRNIGLVLTRNSPTAGKIAEGWKAARAELGLDPARRTELLLPHSRQPEFPAAIDRALDKVLDEGVTGLLVHSDPEAMAFVDVALNRGLSVPDDLSVIAYDDEIAELFTPPLTAISPPRAAVGSAAVDLLLQRIRDPARPVHRVTLNPELVVRGSTAPPRG